MDVASSDIRVFHESLERVCADDSFLDLFYEGFMGSDEHVAGFFTNTDMARQKRKLRSSLQMLTKLIDDEPGADMYMGTLARVHDRYHIPPQMYLLWLDSLIDAVRQCDPVIRSRRDEDAGRLVVLFDGPTPTA